MANNSKPIPTVAAKLSTFGIGLLLKKSIDYGFDYVLYPVALISLGYLWGGVIMTALSVGLNLAVIRAYDWAKHDFLLLETLKEFKEKEANGRIRRFLFLLLKRGDIPAFFVLSWVEDPIVVTLYLRRGAHKFNGLGRRDWLIFLASTVTSNVFWILSVASVIEIVQFLGRFFLDAS